MISPLVLALVLPLILQAQAECFEDQYVADQSFTRGFSFANISDVAIDAERKLVFNSSSSAHIDSE